MNGRSAFEIAKGFAPDSIRSRGNYNRDGHGFQTGDVVYYDGLTLSWKPSSWVYDSLTGSSEALGVVDVKDQYKFDVVYRGSVVLPNTVAVTGPVGTVQENTVYFLSDTPGVLTATPPAIDPIDPKVRKPILVTLNSTDTGAINALVVNYRGYVEDSNSCVAFVQSIVPVGTIDFLPGTKSSHWNGWLLCDGSEYAVSEYPDLFRVIGHAYGVPSNPSKFKVPDFWRYSTETNTGGRIALGKNDGAGTQVDAYSGTDDILLLPDTAGTVDDGAGYAARSVLKNQQAAYHANFYIRATSVEKYVNIESCNGAGGAIRNWLPNGAMTVWQRGVSFPPDPSKTQQDHLADLNRYTADRWFRKVGFCPAGMGMTGSGTPSEYVGVCERKPFNTIETGVPDALRKQYPAHYMEYQSFVSGPSADNSLEYCLLENRIPSVKTLAGETVCVSFWARSDSPGSVYVNLKQHFGYDVSLSTSLLAQISGASTTSGNYGSAVSAVGAAQSRIDTTDEAIGIGELGVRLLGRSTGTLPYLINNKVLSTQPQELQTIFLDADSSAKGGFDAISDRTVLLPNAQQVEQVMLTDLNTVDAIDSELVQVTPPPGKYGVIVSRGPEDSQADSDDPLVFVKNILDPSNEKVEGIAADASAITANTYDINTTSGKTIPITITMVCVPNTTCVTCKPQVLSIAYETTTFFISPAIDPCTAALNGYGKFSIEAGQDRKITTITLSVTDSEYETIQQFVKGDVTGLPSTVVTRAIQAANHLAQTNPTACRCYAETITPVTVSSGVCAEQFTVPKNYDATQTLGICCVPALQTTTAGSRSAVVMSHIRHENQTVHLCTALGGQFISYDAVNYFNQFDSTQCGVTEDQCSDVVQIEVTRSWQQYEVVFRVPSVDNRYIGNSGTDYLALQLWTHLRNGYCQTYSGAEAPPRNRLGTNFGVAECAENALCEPCVSIFPTEFSYRGTLNLAQFQLQTGTEFTAYVQPNNTEDLDYCQGFYESNTCVSRGDYYPISGTDAFAYRVDFKRQKVCKYPEVVISDYAAVPVGLSNIDIVADSITTKGFAIGADVTANNGPGVVKLVYECDCDLYRPEELQYLAKQLQWKAEE